MIQHFALHVIENIQNKRLADRGVGMRDALSVRVKKLAAAGKFANMNLKRGERGKAH